MAWIRGSDGKRRRVKFEDVWGPDPTESEMLIERERLARAECQRRIFQVADLPAQTNMCAVASADLMTDSQIIAWRAGLAWIGKMRSNWRPLAASTRDIFSDGSWPECPAPALELASKF